MVTAEYLRGMVVILRDAATGRNIHRVNNLRLLFQFSATLIESGKGLSREVEIEEKIKEAKALYREHLKNSGAHHE